jgi:RNA-splicing ligase RtcB
VNDLVDEPAAFDRTFDEVVRWAQQNRAAIHELAEEILGPLELILDLPHNTYERVGDGVIIRKGSVHVQPGDLTILPSHLDGDVALLRATGQVNEVLNSLSHGTGRAMSRSEAKPLARIYDFAALRERVLIPSIVSNASLRTDGPFAYRDLEPTLNLITPYVEEVRRFRVAGYIGHL